MRALIGITYFLAVFAMASCHQSGTWEDDAGNWNRAFRSEKPKDVVVLHSKYWRSPHFTYEFEYFFEIQYNEALQRQLFEENKLTRIDGDDAAEAKNNFLEEAPEWFAPKAVDEYDVWIFEDDPLSNFRVFIDRETGNMFLTQYQV